MKTTKSPARAETWTSDFRESKIKEESQKAKDKEDGALTALGHRDFVISLDRAKRSSKKIQRPSVSHRDPLPQTTDLGGTGHGTENRKPKPKTEIRKPKNTGDRQASRESSTPNHTAPPFLWLVNTSQVTHFHTPALGRNPPIYLGTRRGGALGQRRVTIRRRSFLVLLPTLKIFL